MPGRVSPCGFKKFDARPIRRFASAAQPFGERCPRGDDLRRIAPGSRGRKPRSGSLSHSTSMWLDSKSRNPASIVKLKRNLDGAAAAT